MMNDDIKLDTTLVYQAAALLKELSLYTTVGWDTRNNAIKLSETLLNLLKAEKE